MCMLSARLRFMASTYVLLKPSGRDGSATGRGRQREAGQLATAVLHEQTHICQYDVRHASAEPSPPHLASSMYLLGEHLAISIP